MGEYYTSIWETGFEEGFTKGFSQCYIKNFEENLAKELSEIAARNLALGEAEGIAFSITNLMETMNLAREQAMDALKVPPEERAKYAKLL